ncbi:hydrogenase maturation protease [Prauserella cavernicola]|uniref:Hydrogenase maturation protease n=1 Tax=Prauserella cavernicola TaxID=2800127 RepID=A0A934QRQ8_9PSEU|nr:hydrogenase maturation protease [Prauserella cavernicola]MBK1784953.1 hydrogenase maturation protease [Prauserella cavernicola]
MTRVLVAGIGNIFLRDDGFGGKVIERLREEELPEWVELADYGISGVHLAYDLLGGYDLTVLVDATPQGCEPGTVFLIEVSADRPAPHSLDAHGMQPDAVLGLLDLLGGDAGRLVVVGCEPADTGDGIGLTEPVAAAVDEAVRLVCDLARQHEDTTREGVS